MKFKHGSTIEVWRGGSDRYGDRTDALVGTIDQVGVKWGSSADVGDRGGRPVTTATLVFDHTPDIRPADILVIRGIPGKWHTEGRVQPVESPFTGWKPGATLNIEEVG